MRLDEKATLLKLAKNHSAKAIKQIENLTLKNKYISGMARHSKNALEKLKGPEDPLSELGTGISTFHQLLLMLFALILTLALMHTYCISVFASFNFYNGQ